MDTLDDQTTWIPSIAESNWNNNIEVVKSNWFVWIWNMHFLHNAFFNQLSLFENIGKRSRNYGLIELEQRNALVTLRRILEYYFNILGGLNYEDAIG